MLRSALVVIAAALSLVGCAGRVVYGSEAYGGTVTDAETGRPLAGAVVVAVWYRELAIGPHSPSTSYHDSVEVLTGADGAFTVPARTHFTLIGAITGPEFVAYFPGYAPFPSLKAWPKGPEVARAYDERRINFRLTKLSDRDERIKSSGRPTDLVIVPDSSVPNLIRLLNVERSALGLEPAWRH